MAKHGWRRVAVLQDSVGVRSSGRRVFFQTSPTKFSSVVWIKQHLYKLLLNTWSDLHVCLSSNELRLCSGLSGLDFRQIALFVAFSSQSTFSLVSTHDKSSPKYLAVIVHSSYIFYISFSKERCIKDYLFVGVS